MAEVLISDQPVKIPKKRGRKPKKQNKFISFYNK